MPLNIKNTQTHEMAKKLAGLTGVSISKAVKVAIEEKLQHVEQAAKKRRLADELDYIALQCARLPIRDDRTPEKIIGYDENGLPT